LIRRRQPVVPAIAAPDPEVGSHADPDRNRQMHFGSREGGSVYGVRPADALEPKEPVLEAEQLAAAMPE